MSVELHDGEFTLDAALVAEGLGLQASDVLPAIRAGKLTSLCERGTGEDAGRNRLTFFFARRRFRLLVNEAGDILERSSSWPKPKKARPRARLR